MTQRDSLSDIPLVGEELAELHSSTGLVVPREEVGRFAKVDVERSGRR